MLRRVICMQGADAAECFYQPDRLTRVGAIPITVTKLLQGFGSVQLLDDDAHRTRKGMFLSLLTEERSRELSVITEAEWRLCLQRWQAAPRVVLFDELWGLLTRAALKWVRMPLEPAEAEKRAEEFQAMIEGTGSLGPRAWAGLLLRSRCDRWARGVIRQVRAGTIAAPKGSALWVVAQYRDERVGTPLRVTAAANELINLLRPVAAASLYILFAAEKLHSHPEWRQRIAEGDEKGLEHYAQEIRRVSPFFAFIAGRVRKPFKWRTINFEERDWVLLDIFGTNRDSRTWDKPSMFNPDRFRECAPSLFNLIPQGGGDQSVTHRCPGERATLELIKTSLLLLTRAMSYDVPKQDLSVSLARIPTRPNSGFVISNVKAL
jgi:fatty-acid peroxygenase